MGTSSGARAAVPRMISKPSIPTNDRAATHVQPPNIISRRDHLRCSRRQRAAVSEAHLSTLGRAHLGVLRGAAERIIRNSLRTGAPKTIDEASFWAVPSRVQGSPTRTGRPSRLLLHVAHGTSSTDERKSGQRVTDG
jgi:hypothetical protein